MVAQHYRWDFIGLSTDEKPTPATSEKVVDGSTFYCSDNSKLYVYYKDQWYEKEATGGGGTTYEDFVGTDGETAGTHGLVPAPATTDAGKYLKADGTWAEVASGGGIIELTSADYNYPANNPDGIAIWLLNAGHYSIKAGSSQLKVYIDISNSDNLAANSKSELIIAGPDIINRKTYYYAGGYNAAAKLSSTGYTQSDTPTQKFELLNASTIVDNLVSTDTKKPLSAKQGKALNDKIGDLSALNTTDKTSIVAAINEILTRL